MAVRRQRVIFMNRKTPVVTHLTVESFFEAFLTKISHVKSEIRNSSIQNYATTAISSENAFEKLFVSSGILV